jgi:hypothetical protein
VRKNGCALLRFDFIYGDLVYWLEGEYTKCNVDYDTMFDNPDDLQTTDMPPGYPKVDIDQTRTTLKDGAPTKGTFTSNFGHARQRAHYNNHKGMHDHIDIMMDNFEKEEKKSYHLCPPPRSFLYFIPSIMITVLSLIMQKQKIRIIVDPTNAIIEGDTGNTNAQARGQPPAKPSSILWKSPTAPLGLHLASSPKAPGSRHTLVQR